MKLTNLKVKLTEQFEKAIAFFEKRAFGICSDIGDLLGISSSSVRLFFIYASFLTKGSPLIIYLIMVFVKKIHKFWRIRKSSIWDF